MSHLGDFTACMPLSHDQLSRAATRNPVDLPEVPLPPGMVHLLMFIFSWLIASTAISLAIFVLCFSSVMVLSICQSCQCALCALQFACLIILRMHQPVYLSCSSFLDSHGGSLFFVTLVPTQQGRTLQNSLQMLQIPLQMLRNSLQIARCHRG